LVLIAAFAIAATAQSTQGLIAGRIVDSATGRPIASARVSWTNQSTGATGASLSGESGYYDLPQLSPGLYGLRVSADNYQAQQTQDLTLPVAARLELNFQLRPRQDVWEQGSSRSVFLPGSKIVLDFYGPDVDTTRSSALDARKARAGALEATVSDVISPRLIEDLPFAGRDVFAALALLPGVTADSATGRGLGLVVNGQRPYSSNFLLDGVEFNNYLVSGPLAPMAPEAIQEYRVSTTNYLAQYGGTSGLVANAVTRAGGSAFHGIGYGYLQNAILNANDFQRNLSGFGRPSGRVMESGFQVGGPVLKRIPLFFSAALDEYRSRTETVPVDYILPTETFIASTPEGSLARRLLTAYPSLASSVTGPSTATFRLEAPFTIERTLALGRLDYNTADGRHRITGRVVLARTTQPDFTWSPYQDMSSRFDDDANAASISHYFTLSPRLVNEAKIAYGSDDMEWDRAHQEVPVLQSFDSTALPANPGLYSYRNKTTSAQVIDNATWTTGRHIVTFGGGLSWRWLRGYLDPGAYGEYYFSNAAAFAADQPLLFRTAASYVDLPSAVPEEPDRSYRNREFSLFAQDTFRISPRLTVNVGLRYEFFGNPTNIGRAKDPTLRLGPGSTLQEQIAGAVVVVPSAGDQPIFRSQSNGWAPRLGASYDPFASGRTILRGGFGTFRDRFYDALWNAVWVNNTVFPSFVNTTGAPVDYLKYGPSLPPGFVRSGLVAPPRFTFFDPELPSSRSYTWFAGVQQRLTTSLTLEVNTIHSAGRDLIATDVVNRPPGPPDYTALNGNIPTNIRYRGALARSDYHALATTLVYRTSRAQFHLSYTWSHSIDNQSQPLESDLLDFSAAPPTAPIGFTVPYNPDYDRGSSDFDQRHNLVFYSVWQSPVRRSASLTNALVRDWTFSQLAAFRSGFPFSVYSATGTDRADIIDPAQTSFAQPPSVPGGQLVLNRAAFTSPAPGQLGNSGRNAFTGPGLYSIDISLKRSFALAFLGEGGRLSIRADAFNVLNHANLDNPDNLLASATFGIARYGRHGYRTGFTASRPLDEGPRHVQLSLQVQF
jgi:hypothetical protein